MAQPGALAHIPGRKVPEGYRCVTWPTGEERLTKYRRPEEAIIGPACDHLLKMQERCLEATLVCAYVRPDAVDDLEAHGAFRNNKALHDKCVAMRTILLQHDARFRVNLRDAEAADPIFAQKLRDSGVNNSPAQMSQNFKRTAALKADNTPLPQPPAPAGASRSMMGVPRATASGPGKLRWRSAVGPLPSASQQSPRTRRTTGSEAGTRTASSRTDMHEGGGCEVGSTARQGDARERGRRHRRCRAGRERSRQV
ncbi:hypothetical protein [Nannocystis pusilla]|uniref:hypothetical protein n=1 Tax=Nannocystis pusilla TaxID=889268 RepID=UPI003B7B85D9